MGLTAEDRLDIEELLVRYEYASTVTGDESAFSRIFTDDVVLDGPRWYGVGLAGAVGYADLVRPGEGVKRARTRLSNFLIEGDGDEATLRAIFVRIKQPGGDGRHEFVTGSYECYVRRIDGAWKIYHRIIRIDGLPQFRETDEYKSGQRYSLIGDTFVLGPATA